MFITPLNFVLPVWLREKNARHGADGYYHHITENLGAKVYRQPNDEQAEQEYILTCYAYAATKLTAEAWGLGRAKVDINGKIVSRPAIFMQHLWGQNVADYARDLGKQHNAKFSKDDAECWGYESPEFRPIADRILAVCERLQEKGFSCYDHNENFGNFVLETRTGKVFAIDFSVETENEKVLALAYDQCAEALCRAIPSEYVRYMYTSKIIVPN